MFVHSKLENRLELRRFFDITGAPVVIFKTCWKMASDRSTQ